MKDKTAIFMFLQFFQVNQCHIVYPIGSRYVQRLVQLCKTRLSSSGKFKVVPSILEVLMFFHWFSFVESPVQKKSVRAPRNAAERTGNTIGTVNEMIGKSYSTLCRVAQISPPFMVIALYIIFDRKMVWFSVLSLHVNGFALITQKKSLEDVFSPLSGSEGVDSKTKRMAEQVDKKVDFGTSRMRYFICCST